MSGKKRGRGAVLGACATCCVAALGVLGAGGAATAVAQPQQQSDPNPLSTNIPYLAWRGEHLRLVKCTSDLPGGDMDALRAEPKASDGGLNLHEHTDVIVENWSGDPNFKPSVADGTVDLFLTDKGLCVKADVLSQYAGLAQIKLMVTLDPGNDDSLVDILTRSEILTAHEFLAGWMTLGTPTLTEQNVGGDYDATSGNATNSFTASDDPSHDGVLNVRVRGTLPLGNSFSELGLGSTLTLPDQWADLAGVMASDRNPDNMNPANRWDIHDDDTVADGHVWCGDTPIGSVAVGDAVDNCAGGYGFSRWFDADGPGGPLSPIDLGLTENGTIGPFDPEYPNETLLGDGRLDANDAPMPAARIDVGIAANSGAATDTSGIGSLHKSDKTTWYSRDRAAGANAGSGDATPHNLYAPFYSAYVPATADGSWLLDGSAVSGTDGPAMGNDFPGFLVGNGSGGEGDYDDYDNTYDYWDIAEVFRSAAGAQSQCLNRQDAYPAYRSLPQGAQSAAVYTDEHGEAQVGYRPGTGAYYDNIPGVVKNSNGGCDLKNVTTLGTSSITATAKYPYQPTTDVAPKVSPVVTKTVTSLFAKYLSQWPKSTADDSDTAVTRIVVAHAQDVDGSPYAGETVCFVNTSGYGSVQGYVYNGVNARFVGGYDLAGSRTAKDPSDRSPNPVCMKTNDAGNAAVEVSESQGRSVDVVGDFTAEQIRRDFPVDFGAAIPGGQTQGPGSGGQQPSSSGAGATVTNLPAPGAAGNATPSPATNARVDAIVAAAGTGGRAAVKGSTRCVVRFAHLKLSAKGKRSLVVRLEGGTSAKVRIKLFDKKGKARVVQVRRLATGKTVTVTGLKISKQITRASLKVIG